MFSRSIIDPELSNKLRNGKDSGSFFNSGKYSFFAIETGICQVGFITMYSILSENSGLRILESFTPSTVRVSKTTA